MNSLGKFLGKRQMPSSGLVKSSRAGLGGEAGGQLGAGYVLCRVKGWAAWVLRFIQGG